MNGQISQISGGNQAAEGAPAHMAMGHPSQRPVGQTIPARYFPRPRIVSHLHELGQPVVVVTAPAGSGKTSALLAWTEEARVPVRWVSATKPIPEFLRDLVRILSEVTDTDFTAAALDNVDSPAQVFSELHARAGVEGVPASRSAVIVIDDAERLSESGTAVELVRLFLTPNLGVQAVLLTRQTLALPLPAEESRIVCLDLGWLRFDRREIAGILKSDEKDEIVDHVERQTLGWAAGVAALAASHQRRSMTRAGALAELPSDLSAHFEEGLLAELPERVRTELMVAAVADPVTDECLKELLIDTLPPDSLAELALQCPFLSRVEGSGAYRFQPLFRRFLLDRRGQPRLADMHRRAFRWFTGHEDDLGAIDHAIGSGEPSLSADLLRRVAEKLVGLGRVDELERLARSAKPLWNSEPMAALMAAFAAVQLGDDRSACRLVEVAETSLNYLDPRSSLRMDVRAWAAWIRGAAALSMEQESAALEIVQACLREQPGLKGLLASGLHTVKGIAEAETGEHALALGTLALAEQAAREVGAPFNALRAVVGRGRALRLAGRFTEAREVCEGAIRELAAWVPPERALRGKAYLELAQTLLQAEEPTEAVGVAESALRYLDSKQPSHDLAEAREVLARSFDSLADVGGALREAALALEIARRQVCPVLTRRLLALRETLELRHRSTFSGHATLDAATRSISCGGRVVALTKREFEVLDYLRQQGGRWVPSDEIAASVFRSVQHRHSTLVRVHVHAIRQKLGSERRLIESERGRGYRAPPEGLSATFEC